MSKRDPIPNKYTHKHLAEPTEAQRKTVELLKAKCIGLTIFGTMKAASKKKLYLIERNGHIAMSARAYAKWM